MSDPVWDKFSKHDEIIANLQREQATLAAEVKSINERMDRNQTAIIASLSRIETKQDLTTDWMNESKGGLRIAKWLSGLGVAIAGGILAWIKFFKGG